MRKLLLISSSRTHGTGFLAHCGEAIQSRLEPGMQVLFVPYALHDHDAYHATAQSAFESLGYGLDSIHTSADPRQAVLDAEAVFVGGGNSFRLAKQLHELGLIEPLRQRALQGMPYIGSSAGTNMACPTMRTSNDMPIVEPPTLNVLGLVPFQINPHFIDANPESTHQGETREQRLAEYLEENEAPVLGIREGTWLVVDGDIATLEGAPGGMLFRRGSPPSNVPTGSQFSIAAQQLRPIAS